MLAWLKRWKLRNSTERRPVHEATAYESPTGRVVRNKLDPSMQRFMDQCIGAIKAAGMRAAGTGQFSIVLGASRRAELQLDEFWNEFAPARDAAVITRVVEAARAKLNVGARGDQRPAP